MEQFVGGKRVVGIVLLAGSGLFMLLLAWPILQGTVATTWDAGWFQLPMRYFYANCLRNGHSFDWMPGLYCGWYATGEGQMGGYHPVHLLLYPWLPLNTAFAIETILLVPIGLAGTYLFLCNHVDRTAALVGTVAFSFCNMHLHQLYHFHTGMVFAHTPWLLWGIDMTVSGSQSRARFGTLVIALGIGSEVLLGSPPFLWYSCVFCLAYTVFLIAVGRTEVNSLLRLVGGVTLGVCLGAVQLFPTLLHTLDSSRDAVDLEFVLEFALSFRELPGLLFPEGSPITYLGAVPWMLLAWRLGTLDWRRLGWKTPGWTVRKYSQLPYCLFLVAVAAVGILMALGAEGGLYYLHAHLPMVGRFRAPIRFLLLTHLSMALLAAFAFDALRQTRSAVAWQDARQLSNPLRQMAWPTVVLAAACLLAGSRLVSGHALTPTLGALAVFISAWAGLFLAITFHRVGQLALVCVLLVDLAGSSIFHPENAKSFWKNAVPLTQFCKRGPQPPQPTEARLFVENAILRNHPVMNGMQLASGYSALEPNKQLTYADVNALRLANVEWKHSFPCDASQLIPVGTWERLKLPINELGHPANAIRGMSLSVYGGTIRCGKLGCLAKPSMTDSPDTKSSATGSLRTELLGNESLLRWAAPVHARYCADRNAGSLDSTVTEVPACSRPGQLSDHRFGIYQFDLKSRQITVGDSLFVDLFLESDDCPLEICVNLLVGDRWLGFFWGAMEARFPMSEHQRRGLTRMGAIAYPGISKQSDHGWSRIERPVSRARLIARALPSKIPCRDLRQIDVHNEALVSHHLDLDADASGTVSIAADEPGYIRLQAESTGRQLLVLSESYHRGWIASIDGKKCTVKRVNGDFLGCVVGSGEHCIEFRFCPRELWLGRLISVSATLICSLLGLRAWRSCHP